eukprot:3170874-Rhodomonas_salina.1
MALPGGGQAKRDGSNLPTASIRDVRNRPSTPLHFHAPPNQIRQHPPVPEMCCVAFDFREVRAMQVLGQLERLPPTVLHAAGAPRFAPDRAAVYDSNAAVYGRNAAVNE